MKYTLVKENENYNTKSSLTDDNNSFYNEDSKAHLISEELRQLLLDNDEELVSSEDFDSAVDYIKIINDMDNFENTGRTYTVQDWYRDAKENYPKIFRQSKYDLESYTPKISIHKRK